MTLYLIFKESYIDDIFITATKKGRGVFCNYLNLMMSMILFPLFFLCLKSKEGQTNNSKEFEYDLLDWGDLTIIEL